MDYEDPGWKDVVRTALIRSTVVGLLWRRARLSAAPSALVGLRYIFMGIAGAVWLFLFVLSFIGVYRMTDTLATWAGAVIIAGFICALRIRALERRLSRTRSDIELMVGYRAIFFIQLGLAQLPSLVAFVGAFLAHSVWIYVVGAVVSSINLVRMAPSRRNIVRIQELLNSAGSPASLGRVLTTSQKVD